MKIIPHLKYYIKNDKDLYIAFNYIKSKENQKNNSIFDYKVREFLYDIHLTYGFRLFVLNRELEQLKIQIKSIFKNWF